MLLVSGLDEGLVIGTLIAGATLFILAMMSVVIFFMIANSLFETESSDACDKWSTPTERR
jgi:high-affinity nickel permease